MKANKMFSELFGKKKNQTTAADDGNTDAATKDSVSEVPTEAKKQEKNNKKSTWIRRLFGQCQPSVTSEDTTEIGSTADKSIRSEPNKKPKKTRWWQRLCRCCKKRNRVLPLEIPVADEKEPQTRNVPETKNNKIKSKESQHSGVTFKEALEEPTETISKDKGLEDTLILPYRLDSKFILEQTIIEKLIEEELKNTKRSGGDRFFIGNATPPVMDPLGTEMRSDGDGFLIGNAIPPVTDPFGFPNMGQTCYMNSSLQSLLTLEDFVRDLSKQEPVWCSVPQAQLIRTFMALRDVHRTTKFNTKMSLLQAFKHTVSVNAPEFSADGQKDAHEFLTSVLDQIRRLSPLLKQVASRSSRRYTCPVENHLVFTMENTRTCKSCGEQSKKIEKYTNLSLALLPGGTVEDILEDYLEEKEIEYRCGCGGNTSTIRLAFKTLPRLLVLHIKRFTYSPAYELVKLQDPVVLLRNLVVCSEQEGHCYSLVSTISHLGYTGDGGHYICDSIDPDEDPALPSDDWLTFNDREVTHTTGGSVCDGRQESAYVLFYKRFNDSSMEDSGSSSRCS